MSMRRAAAVLLLGLLAAGCSGSGSGSDAAPSPSTASTASSPASSAPSSAPSSPPSSAPSSSRSGTALPGSGAPTPRPSRTAVPVPTSGSTITVDGVVQRGVEPGCLVLRAGAKSYLLLRTEGGEGARDVPVAVPVRVRGRLVTGVASYCQQGTPLRVDTITRR